MPQGNRGGVIPWWVFEPPQPLAAGAAAATAKLQWDEQAAAEAVYGETSGLYPRPRDPNRRVDDPSNWDSRSYEELQAARRSLAAISERNEDIHRADGSASHNPLEVRQWREAASAARARDTADIPPKASWFNIRNADVTPRPARNFPGGGRPVFWGTYGPFVDVGGGDVGGGRNIVIDIYTLPGDKPNRR